MTKDYSKGPLTIDATEAMSVKSKLKELLPSDFERLEKAERYRALTMAAVQFESFVVDLLRSKLRSMTVGDNLDKSLATAGRFDFVVDVSLHDLPPPIVFEVKFFQTPSHMKAALPRLVGLVEPGDQRFRTFVIVTNQEPSAADRATFSRSSGEGAESLQGDVKYTIWGPSTLQQLVDDLKEEGQRIVQTLPVAGLGAALRSVSLGLPDEWKIARAGIVSELGAAWRNDQLVFFLGAGVSIDAGVPLWSKLLATLYSDLVEHIAPSRVTKSSPNNLIKAVDALISLQDGSPLLNARSIRAGLPGDFNETVRAALYANTHARNSLQLSALARLCDPPRGRVGARAVVTYNFDDLLEQTLLDLNVNYLSVCTGDSRAAWTQLPIYHVHGLIPQKGPIPPDQTLVFSEEGYHTAYNNPYTWSNVVQLNLMTQHTCLFVGLSMTDPNLRRLLEIANAAKSGPRHVALLRRARTIGGARAQRCDSSDFNCALKTAQATPNEVVETVLAIHHNAWETTLKELGVRVLWFEEFQEIPQILNGIRAE